MNVAVIKLTVTRPLITCFQAILVKSSKVYNITVLGRNNYHKIVIVFNSLNIEAFKLNCA